jgi:O-antigen/teichoic acid export membrane protein
VVLTATDIAGVLFGVGLVNAMACLYFDRTTPGERSLVVSTAFVGFGGLALVGVVLTAPLAYVLARIFFGSTAQHGLFTLALLGLLASLSVDLGLGYLRLGARSWTFVGVSLTRTVLLLSSTIFFVVGMDMGVAGIFCGTLLSGSLVAGALAIAILREVGVGFNRPLLGEMLKVGLPLSPAALGDSVVESSDKYVLNRYLGATVVGPYALGGRLAALLATFISAPFGQIWVVRRLETMRIGEQAPFAQIFTYYVMVMTTAGLGLSLLAPEVVRALAAPEFASAAVVIPLLALAHIMTGVNTNLQIGIYHAKRTDLLLWISLACALASIPLQLVLAPRWGIVGAGAGMALINALRATLTGWAGHRWVGAQAGIEWRRSAATLALAAVCYGVGVGATGQSIGVGSFMVRLSVFGVFLAALVLTPIMSRAERRGLVRLLRHPADLAVP